jgi:hypothetical protein
MAITGYTRGFIHNGLAGFGDPVKKGGFPNIGSSYYCNDVWHEGAKILRF